jgi:hypothetical protein
MWLFLLAGEYIAIPPYILSLKMQHKEKNHIPSARQNSYKVEKSVF